MKYFLLLPFLAGPVSGAAQVPINSPELPVPLFEAPIPRPLHIADWSAEDRWDEPAILAFFGAVTGFGVWVFREVIVYSGFNTATGRRSEIPPLRRMVVTIGFGAALGYALGTLLE